MLKHKKIVVPIYGGASNSSLNIIIADKKDWDKALTLINKYNSNKDNFFEYDQVKAFCTMSDKNGINHFWMIFKESKLDMNTIAHEVVHAVNNIYISRGISLDARNDEPQAYLTGWATEVTTKFLKSYIKL